jgi:hypothetical protein
LRKYKKRENKFDRKNIKCECGCGENIVVAIGAKSPIHNRRFKTGHNSRVRPCDRPHWKGGKIINSQGYILIYKPDHQYATRDGYVREHRLVMEKKLGRYLKPNEVVHHIDGNKQNNKLSNLKLMTETEHKSLEMKKRYNHNS